MAQKLIPTAASAAFLVTDSMPCFAQAIVAYASLTAMITNPGLEPDPELACLVLRDVKLATTRHHQQRA